MGGGILPTTIYNNKLYFLFGKENRYSSSGYSDFGGSKEDNESFLDTAVREGSEELCGFLGSDKDIKKLLKKNGYYNIDFNDRYRTYIFPIEYDPMLIKYFNNNHKFVEKHLNKDVINNSKIFEKCEIKWICIDDLIKLKKTFRYHFQQINYKIYDKREEIYKFIKKNLK